MSSHSNDHCTKFPLFLFCLSSQWNIRIKAKTNIKRVEQAIKHLEMEFGGDNIITLVSTISCVVLNNSRVSKEAISDSDSYFFWWVLNERKYLVKRKLVFWASFNRNHLNSSIICWNHQCFNYVGSFDIHFLDRNGMFDTLFCGKTKKWNKKHILWAALEMGTISREKKKGFLYCQITRWHGKWYNDDEGKAHANSEAESTYSYYNFYRFAPHSLSHTITTYNRESKTNMHFCCSFFLALQFLTPLFFAIASPITSTDNGYAYNFALVRTNVTAEDQKEEIVLFSTWY